MKKLIGMVALVMVAVSGAAFAADEQPAESAHAKKASVSQAPVVQAVTGVQEEATDVVTGTLDRRQARREKILPAAGEVTKEADDVVKSGMERRQTRWAALLGVGGKTAETPATK